MVSGGPGIAIFVNGTLQTGTQAGLDNGLPGVIDFQTAPASGAALTWTGQFFWLCRIDNDKTEFQQDMHGLWSLKKLTFTTIKL